MESSDRVKMSTKTTGSCHFREPARTGWAPGFANWSAGNRLWASSLLRRSGNGRCGRGRCTVRRRTLLRAGFGAIGVAAALDRTGIATVKIVLAPLNPIAPIPRPGIRTGSPFPVAVNALFERTTSCSCPISEQIVSLLIVRHPVQGGIVLARCSFHDAGAELPPCDCHQQWRQACRPIPRCSMRTAVAC